jgi:hypothetical protein
VIDRSQARSIAEKAQPQHDVALDEPRELPEGWFFPHRTQLIGSHGVVVNKHTGRVFHLGSAFPVERDLALYDRGYQFERFDLVVLTIRDLNETRRALYRVGLQVIDVSYDRGQVLRIPRSMTDLELWGRLERVPCVFPDQALHARLEALEEARNSGWFTFEVLEYRPPDLLGAE